MSIEFVLDPESFYPLSWQKLTVWSFGHLYLVTCVSLVRLEETTQFLMIGRKERKCIFKKLPTIPNRQFVFSDEK